MERKPRVNTDVSYIVTQLHRQKSIYKNLSWQIRQRDKKINFLEKYFSDLQRVINKEQLDDEVLKRKVEQQRQRKNNSYIYRYPTEVEREQGFSMNKKRIATQTTNHEDYFTPNRSVVIRKWEK